MVVGVAASRVVSGPGFVVVVTAATTVVLGAARICSTSGVHSLAGSRSGSARPPTAAAST
jgi:hypothetical protein